MDKKRIEPTEIVVMLNEVEVETLLFCIDTEHKLLNLLESLRPFVLSRGFTMEVPSREESEAIEAVGADIVLLKRKLLKAKKEVKKK